MGNIDLHVHTTASDGTFTPSQVVQEAVKVGLTAVAITDHDTVQGISEALNEAGKYDLEVIPGIEINTDHNHRELHILGYYLDYRQQKLLTELNSIANSRIIRIRRIIDKLCALGFDITLEEVQRQSRIGTIGRPHIARTLVDKGYVSCIGQAFGQFLGSGCPAYVPRESITACEAVRLICQAGGIAVWAHPGHTNDDLMLERLIQAGLKGIEVYYPDHNKEQTEHYRKMAAEKGLLLTGGSDFHGDIIKNKSWLGSMAVPEELLHKIRQAAGRVSL